MVHHLESDNCVSLAVFGCSAAGAAHQNCCVHSNHGMYRAQRGLKLQSAAETNMDRAFGYASSQLRVFPPDPPRTN